MGKGAVIGILILLVMIGLCVGGYFWLSSNGYFDQLPEQPEIEKISYFLEPFDSFTNKPVELEYQLIESQVVIECLKDNILQNYKKYEQNLADNDASLQKMLRKEKINTSEYEKLRKAYVRNESSRFYTIHPELYGMNVHKDSLSGDYCYLSGLKETDTQQGTLIKGLNQFLLKKDTLYTFYYWKEGEYYFNKYILMGVPIPEDLNLSKLPEDEELVVVNQSVKQIYVVPIAKNVSIDIWGDINSNQSQYIRLNLKGDNEFRRIHICFEWTFGVIDVKSSNIIDDLPVRLNKIANKCFKMESSLTKANYFQQSYDFEVLTSSLIPGDYLKIYVLDEDRYDPHNDRPDVEDSNGQNLGAQDFVKIRYLKEGISN